MDAAIEDRTLKVTILWSIKYWRWKGWLYFYVGVHSITFNRIYLVLLIHTHNRYKRDLAYQIHIKKRALSTRITSKWILSVIGGASEKWISASSTCAASLRGIGDHGLQNFALPVFITLLIYPLYFSATHKLVRWFAGFLPLSCEFIATNSLCSHNVFKQMLL